MSGSEKRIKELKILFDSPDRYGKGLVWDGYTVHDAANVLRRYLNDLPEPVVPLDLYEKFRDPLRGATKQAVGDAEGPQFVDNFDEKGAIEKYQRLITELPPLNKQLLLYILDLLAVFAAKSDENRMNSQNLAAIFQPGMLSHPAHAMAPEEYRLNQCVIIFLIENQDHFLIGMQGTAADEITMKEVASGTPNGPLTPNPNRQSGLGRTASNASAGADSVRREGKIRRNRSVSSKHSKNDGTVTPSSPAPATTPTSGLGRSNTLPAKRSPALVGGKFKKHGESGHAQRSPALEPLTQAHPFEEDGYQQEAPSPSPAVIDRSILVPESDTATHRSQEKHLAVPVPQEASTPSKERNLQGFFQRSPADGNDRRQPNKLRKKKIPGSVNISAQSSTASLPHSYSNAPSPALEAPNPMESTSQTMPQPLPEPIPETAVLNTDSPRQISVQTTEMEKPLPHSDEHQSPAPLVVQQNSSAPVDATHRTSQTLGNNSLHPSDISKGKKSPPTSLHSSFNEGSDLDQVLEELPAPVPVNSNTEKEKKSRWRLSRNKKEDYSGLSGSPRATPPHFQIGSNMNADISTTSIGSALNKSRNESITAESSDHQAIIGYRRSSHDGGRDNGRDDPKGPIGWIKSKYREAKETAEQRRNKSPPADHRLGTSISSRGKSLDLRRDHRDEEKSTPKDSSKESLKEVHKNASQEVLKEGPNEPPYQAVRDARNQTVREVPPEDPVEVLSEAPKAMPQEVPPTTADVPGDGVDALQVVPKEPPKFQEIMETPTLSQTTEFMAPPLPEAQQPPAPLPHDMTPIPTSIAVEQSQLPQQQQQQQS